MLHVKVNCHSDWTVTNAMRKAFKKQYLQFYFVSRNDNVTMNIGARYGKCRCGRNWSRAPKIRTILRLMAWIWLDSAIYLTGSMVNWQKIVISGYFSSFVNEHTKKLFSIRIYSHAQLLGSSYTKQFGSLYILCSNAPLRTNKSKSIKWGSINPVM